MKNLSKKVSLCPKIDPKTTAKSTKKKYYGLHFHGDVRICTYCISDSSTSWEIP